MDALATPVAATRGPWTGVEVRHLVTLEAVGSAGSFRAAATSLGCAQSAVSQQIAALERAVGTRLVERTPGRHAVTLTPAGSRLATHGGDVVARLIAARADLATVTRSSETDVLRLAVDRLIAPVLLPRLLLALERTAPALTIELSEVVGTVAPESLVAAGAVDAVLGELPANRESVVGRELVRDPFMLLVGADSPLARVPQPPAVEQLARLRLVGLGPWSTTNADQHLTPVIETASSVTAATLVRSGAGAAIVPRLACDVGDTSIVAVDLSAVVPPRPTGVYRHKHRHETGSFDLLSHVAAAVMTGLDDDRGAPERPGIPLVA